MDYDNWLQRSAGCFNDGPDTRECWNSIGSYFWNDVQDYLDTTSCKEFLKDSPYLIDAISDLWDKELEIDKYDENSPYLIDIWELSEKYPEVADEFFNRVKPKNIKEFRNLVSDDDIVDYYNSYWDRGDW